MRRRDLRSRISQSWSEDEVWDALTKRISQGKVIPIIGSAVRNNRIFDVNDDQDLGIEGVDDDFNTPQSDEFGLDVDAELAEIWADMIHYPLPDRFKLARVAQFNRVKSFDAEQAKDKYLKFLKKALLDVAEYDPELKDQVSDLRSQTSRLSFSQIAKDLGYPRYTNGMQDPLQVLAKLPLPIYVTTSYYDFLERALVAQDRTPRIQVCFWDDEPQDVLEEHRPDPDFVPTVENPLVYHLHGLERYPRTLVLSEDDYLDFLVKISEPTVKEKPIIPLYLRSALVSSSLMLLGYRLEGWDFRVLFRGLINARQNSQRSLSFVVQLAPDVVSDVLTSSEAKNEARQYLQAYFGDMFKVEWGDSEKFISRLWQHWRTWQEEQA